MTSVGLGRESGKLSLAGKHRRTHVDSPAAYPYLVYLRYRPASHRNGGRSSVLCNSVTETGEVQMTDSTWDR